MQFTFLSSACYWLLSGLISAFVMNPWYQFPLNFIILAGISATASTCFRRSPRFPPGIRPRLPLGHHATVQIDMTDIQEGMLFSGGVENFKDMEIGSGKTVTKAGKSRVSSVTFLRLPLIEKSEG